MVDKAKVAAIIFGVLALIFYIGSLATPWFILTVDTETAAADFKCTVTSLYFWDSLVCSTDGETKTFNSTTYYCECPDENNWRQLCRDAAGDNGCKDLMMSFDVSGALVGTSMGVFILGFIAVIVVNVAEKLEVKMTWIPVGMFSLATAILIVPVIYYPIVFPTAYDDAGGCAGFSNQDSTPCDIFSGSSSVGDSGTTTSLTWGSAGWVLSVIVIFFLSINILQAVRGRRRPYLGNY